MSDEQEQPTIENSNPSSGLRPPSPARGEGNIEMTNEELLNNWKHAAADLDNFRKRTAAERVEILQHAKELTIFKLLPSLQSLEQVLSFAPQDDKYKEWLEGLKATITQLEKTMEELGVVKIKTVGKPFDPKMHEAIEEVEGQPGEIIKEIQPGFMLNDKVIIPAKVVVGKSV